MIYLPIIAINLSKLFNHFSLTPPPNLNYYSGVWVVIPEEYAEEFLNIIGNPTSDMLSHETYNLALRSYFKFFNKDVNLDWSSDGFRSSCDVSGVFKKGERYSSFYPDTVVTIQEIEELFDRFPDLNPFKPFSLE